MAKPIEQKRREAEERNAAYQALPLEEKMTRNSTKVQAKLVAQQSRQNKKAKK